MARRGRGARRQARARIALGSPAQGGDRQGADTLAGGALARKFRTLPSHACSVHTRASPRAPQDKACIDQNNIQQSLACLPVFLAGCQTLLVVAGPTYCSRLWCVMELFTFARSELLAAYIRTFLLATIRQRSNPDRVTSDCCSSLSCLSHIRRCGVCGTVGGDQERVEIHLIAHPDDDQTEARRRLTEQFATFDAAKAQCFLASDREHLLAVIEAGFGDFDDFNRVARSLLVGRVSRRDSGSWSRLVAPL